MKIRRGLGKGLGTGYKNLIPIDAHIHSLSAKGILTHLPLRLKASDVPTLAKQLAVKEGKDWSQLKSHEHFDYFTKAEKQLSAKKKLDLKIPTVQILTAKQFDDKFKDDYEEWEQGYATTKIMPDGTTKVYVRDDGNSDYTREGKLLMHELKEIEIFKDLVNNKHINPDIADEMAHNMNPVKVEGVSDTYELNANN